MRYRTLGRVSAKWAAVSFLLSFAVLLPLPSWLQDGVNWGTIAVFAMACSAAGVWLAANLPVALGLSGGESVPEVTPPQPGRPGAESMAAIRLAYLAGTYSVNGKRYPGPPPPAMHEETVFDEVSCEIRDGARLFRGSRRTEKRMLPSGTGALSGTGRISKSECDGCGVPMDVAWCMPSASYLCGHCSYPARAGW